MVYRETEAYDFSLFEPQVVEQPKKQGAKKAKSAKKAASAKKTTQKTKQHTSAKVIDNYQYEVERDAQKLSIPSSLKKAMCFGLVCFAMMIALLVMHTKCDTLMTEIATVQSSIDIAHGENVRLNAELSSMIATDKIEEYAVNELGMVKAESYQINYIDLSEGDEIVVSGDKTVSDNESGESKIKTLFAYIF